MISIPISRILIITALLLLLSLLAYIPLFAQTGPGDWSHAKWGMRQAELLKSVEGAMPGDTSEHFAGAWVGAKVDAIEIAGIPFEVRFQMDSTSGRLSRAVYKCIASPSSSIFETISKSMIEQYGQSAERSEVDSRIVRIWHLKKTNVALTWINLGSDGLNLITLNYSAAK